jgi:hypothetical protein
VIGSRKRRVGTLDLTKASVLGLTAVGVNAQQIQGYAICPIVTAPQDTYVLTWVAASNWFCPAPGGTGSANASSLQGTAVSSTAPQNGQVLTYNGTLWLPQAITGFLPLGGGTLTGNLTLPGNATGVLQAVPLQQLTGLLSSKADLVNSFVPPAELGSGSSGLGTKCLLDNSTFGTCPNGGTSTISNGNQGLMPFYTAAVASNLLGPSSFYDNGAATLGSYNGTQYLNPQGQATRPGMAISVGLGSTGLPQSSGLGFYLAQVGASWSVTSASIASGTATLAITKQKAIGRGSVPTGRFRYA